jgi:NAD+ diphosphatase
MRVEYRDRILLGRQASWPPGMHSVLAGFVEPGESLEDTVRRETHEEVGLAIGEVRYFGSQPWPFPSSLMVGFVALAMDDKLNLNRDEIDSAAWFTREQLINSPEDETFKLSRKDSISRALVNDWIAQGK